jgi:hypothetical protein
MHISHLRGLAVQQLAELVAQRRVERCKRWLNRNAPPCWHRNFFEPLRDGTAMSRVNTSYDTDSPLALAFETQAVLANQSGYVTEAQVVNHFRLSSRWLRAHGCSVLGRDPAHVGSSLLNSVWSTAMRDHPSGSTAYRHQTALDRRFAEMDFSEPSRPGWRQRLFGWLRPQRA